jgi:hypothetical protein
MLLTGPSLFPSYSVRLSFRQIIFRASRMFDTATGMVLTLVLMRHSHQMVPGVVPVLGGYLAITIFTMVNLV